MDACTSAKDMWKRVERLMRGTIQNKVDKEMRFTNEFDQFVVEPGEALVSVSTLQPEWLKYVTQVHLAKRLTVDLFDDLFDYLQQFEKLVNASRAKNPTSVVDYDDEYQQDDVHNNSEDPLVSAIIMQSLRDRGDIQRRNICGSVEKDTHVPDLCAVEKLARNAYQEAEKQQIFAQQVQKQNTHLTSQLEMYKERSQLVRDRDIIRDLEKQRDKLDLDVKNYKRKNEELQKTHSILKRQMSKKEDTYHDTILDLEAKLKKNVDLILKLGNSLQGMFMLGPKPLSVYDQQLKHGLGYPNPYTLKQEISKCPKLYVASSLGNLEIPLNVRDSDDTLEDAFKIQQKMKEKK
ncbi:hypothetical protein Tco_0655876 [Tanacetum coccineum]|uniref:Uncharacterized protein n=1 Tax=Tanacetum coccineum TaxID=301880 RepID=A0ABQ4X8F1_9ASTR